MTRRCGEDGFTIVELLVTLVIIGVLASAAIPLAELSMQRTKERELRHALREIRDAIDAYKKAGDDGHMIRKIDQSGYPHSLQELVDGVDDAKDVKGGRIRFLRRIPRDPFANQDIESAKTWGKRSYASSHEDPRDGEDVYDVYSLTPGAGLNGIAYREW